MNLRKEAKGRDCTVRLPCCRWSPETVVLAHLRLAGITGAGQKAPDQLAAFACDLCHAEVDRRTQLFEADFVSLAFYEAIFRTQYILIKEGKIK